MLWQIFKRLNFTQLFALTWLFLKNPLYAIPTILATKRCMYISYKEYGSIHHLGNPANAFRHALWVILIIKKCLPWQNNEQKAKTWAKKFTDWHEDFSQNETIERAMDLHNNHMGRVYFDKVKNKKEAEIISFLKQKATEAVKISTLEELKHLKTELVYID